MTQDSTGVEDPQLTFAVTFSADTNEQLPTEEELDTIVTSLASDWIATGVISDEEDIETTLSPASSLLRLASLLLVAL